MWRRLTGNTERRLETGSVVALLFGVALLAAMFWMGMTGNRFCCDSKSLLLQLYRELVVAES
jgi:hypothetical protein